MPVTFHVLTVFPPFVQTVFEYGVLRRAVEAGTVAANVVDLRDFTDDRHRTTDDAPYGGGPGMVMLAEPVFRAVEHLRTSFGNLPLIYLSPAGDTLDHAVASKLADELAENAGGVILLCGRYEGIDQRIIDELVDREISVGDYVLSGGELAAMVVIDAVARLLPGVLGNEESAEPESFASGLLDWPHYTRPEDFRGLKVPEVLLSGNHAKIKGFREESALVLTYRRRPDLLSAEQLARVKQLLAEGRHEE